MQKYVKMFLSFNEETGMLTDAEVGRLVRQIIEYAKTEDCNRFIKGNERFAFMIYKGQIDRDKDEYAATVQKRTNAARTRWAREKADSMHMHSVHQVSCTCMQDKDKDKDQDKDKDKESITAPTVAVIDSSAGARDDGGGGDSLRAMANTLEAYAANNLQVLSPGNMEDLHSFAEDMPEDVIRFAIDSACANGVRKWAYVRAILAAWREKGVRTLGEAKADRDAHVKPDRSRDRPSNPALNYEQRVYSDTDFADFFVDLGR